MGGLLWRAFGYLLPVGLGGAYAVFIGAYTHSLAWIASVAFAAALLAVRSFLTPAQQWTSSRLPVLLVTLLCVVAGFGAVTAAGLATSKWLPPVLAVVGLLGLVLALLLTSGKRRLFAVGGVECVNRALILPLTTALLAGAGLGSFNWFIPLALLPGTAAAIACGEYLVVRSGQQRGSQTRLAPIGAAILAAGGVALAGSLLPGPSEIRLLAVAAPVVVVVMTLGALLHPSLERGERLVCVLVRLTLLVTLLGFTLLYILH